MITDRDSYFDNRKRRRLIGLSTDEKPTEEVGNGSIFTEIDTGKTYLFNEEGETWHEQPSGSGGGAGACAISMTDVSTTGM